MMLVFDNPVLYVVDYPAQDAVEVIDKRSGMGAFMQDGAAQRFRAELGEFVARNPELEDFDEFLGEYADLLSRPALVH